MNLLFSQSFHHFCFEKDHIYIYTIKRSATRPKYLRHLVVPPTELWPTYTITIISIELKKTDNTQDLDLPNSTLLACHYKTCRDPERIRNGKGD